MLSSQGYRIDFLLVKAVFAIYYMFLFPRFRIDIEMVESVFQCPYPKAVVAIVLHAGNAGQLIVSFLDFPGREGMELPVETDQPAHVGTYPEAPLFIFYHIYNDVGRQAAGILRIVHIAFIFLRQPVVAEQSAAVGTYPQLLRGVLENAGAIIFLDTTVGRQRV